MDIKTISGFATLVACVTLICSCSSHKTCYTANRAPLQQTRFIELPLGSIGADGWMLEMLRRQADGLTGHLDKLYPQVVGSRNGWLGGDGDQWERGPYWIDGLLPLAYILHDEDLIAKTTPWIEWALASAQPSGQFGPAHNYPPEAGLQRDNCEDWWPRMVVLKVLQQYYSATSDERVITLMTDYFRYQLENLDEKPLDNWTFWARYRGGDNLMCVYWLYNITGDKFLLDLGEKLYRQTEPFTEQFLERDRLTRIGSIHSVNLAQGLKTPMVYWQYDHDKKYPLATAYALDDLYRYHGYPTGMFSGDEAIHGNNPTQGTELCTIVEYMFSLETLYKISGELRFADLLEKVAFNALPAQTSDDYMTRQYYQQVNQISSLRQPNNFDCDHAVDNCFGLLTGYPCCTANMHQGWPKFVQNSWYATLDGGLAAVQYIPTHLEAMVAGGEKVRFEQTTNYPFDYNVDIRLVSGEATFPLILRIPAWSTSHSIRVCGKEIDSKPDSEGLVRIERKWKAGDEVHIEFTPELKLTTWHENARTLERGPLVYSLKIPSETTKVMNTIDASSQGDWYYEIRPKGDWNYALIQTSTAGLDENYKVDDRAAKGQIVFPWNEENAPIRIKAKAVKVPEWTKYHEMAGPLHYSIGYGFKTADKVEEVELIPYGCTKLRITEFPMKGQHDANGY